MTYTVSGGALNSTQSVLGLGLGGQVLGLEGCGLDSKSDKNRTQRDSLMTNNTSGLKWLSSK